MKTLYANIDKDWIDKNEAMGRKTTKENTGEENNDLTFEEVEIRSIDAEFDDNINFNLDTKLGYLSFTWEMSMRDLISILEIAIKKSNKIKTMLESIK